MTLPAFERQDERPLYPRVFWNRPVSRLGAGRLLIVGGHSGEFSQPTALHAAAMSAGAGEAVVAMPDVLAKLLGGTAATSFVPSSTSGSLGRGALAQVLELAEEADAVLVGTSLSNHSDTTILVESLIRQIERPVIIYDDAVTLLTPQAKLLVDNPRHLLIVTMPQVFKLAGQLGVHITIKENGGLVNKLEIVRDLAAVSKCSYVIWGSEIIVAVPGQQMTVTPINHRLATLEPVIAGALATFWIQNQSQPLAGLTSAAYVLREVSLHLPDQSRPPLTEALKLIRQAIDTAEDSSLPA